ncbi:glycoside hydrolase family 24 protein [Amanita thiersii Skay4041]|uniref:Glycoside hydrolase family 24 protein n=1 Tax=Amanita thiersii Skay4041 TaxID=703135 RepID=A0A2A9NNJ3_9AGAR|nr:glycoside hydrolase family 24 protein [Amanita thiersii Skay4041]
MLFTLIALSALAGIVRATLNGQCTANGIPGVCLSTTTCSSGGGTSIAGFCPNDPTDVRCCVKTSCGSGGNCRWTSQCASGNTVSGLCPGPSDFKCCLPSGCAPPPVNSATMSLIERFEGFVASPAPDPIGLPTVGYGHLCSTSQCTELGISFPMTQTQAVNLLLKDLKTFENCISADIVDSVRLNDNQYGALVSWAFNVGCGNAQSSTLVARLNAGENPNTVAAEELPKWVKAGGVTLPGLVTRRAAEVDLFQTPSSIIAHPPSC